jgi:Mg/Co/Ni transporter MgtE
MKPNIKYALDLLASFSDQHIWKADGYDDCIIGYVVDDDTGAFRLVYSVQKILDTLSKDMNYAEACEYFDFNIRGSRMENSPIWCYDLDQFSSEQ